MVIKMLPEQKSFGERPFIGCIVIQNTQKVKHFREKFCTAVDKDKEITESKEEIENLQQKVDKY